MDIFFLRLRDNEQTGSLEGRLLNWLHTALITKKLNREMSRDERQEIDREEMGFVRSQNCNIPTKTMALASCVQALRGAYEVAESIKILLAGEGGWQAIQTRFFRNHDQVHWIGDKLPKDWKTVAHCIFYVPQYSLCYQNNGVDKYEGVVSLPCLPVPVTPLASYLIREPLQEASLIKESAPIQKEQQRPIWYISTQESDQEWRSNHAITEEDFGRIIEVVDKKNRVKQEQKNTLKKHTLLLKEADRARQYKKDLPLYKWLEDDEYRPVQVYGADRKQCDIRKESELYCGGGYRVSDGEITREKKEDLQGTIHPKCSRDSLLGLRGYKIQIQDFFTEQDGYLLLPATPHGLSSILTREEYRGAYGSIWAVLQESGCKVHNDWVWKYHRLGYYNLIILGEKVLSIYERLEGGSPAPIQCEQWLLSGDAGQEIHSQTAIRVSKLGLLQQMLSCWLRNKTSPEEVVVTFSK